jgi:hypothetical protein
LWQEYRKRAGEHLADTENVEVDKLSIELLLLRWDSRYSSFYLLGMRGSYGAE